MKFTLKLLVITGAPGSGKTTLARRLCAESGFRRWPSWTTRSPRAEEVDGNDYVYVTDAAFSAAVDRGELLEHVTLPNGARYGLPVLPNPMAASLVLVAIVDEGAANRVVEAMPPAQCTVVEVQAPQESLAARMRARGDSEADIHVRERWRERPARR